MTRKVIRRTLVCLLVAYLISMYVGTHIPEVPDALAVFSDKLMHMCAYGGLGVLTLTWLSSRKPVSLRRVGALWALIAVYGIFDEVTQPLFGRHAEVSDWLADLAGSGLGLAITWPVAYRVFTRGDS